MRKKICLLIVLVLIASAAVFAADIVVIGYGSTPNAAKVKALELISEQVYGIMVSSSVETNVIDSNSGRSDKEYASSASFSTFGTLYGVVYSEAEKTKGSERSLGSYKVTATLSDSPKLRNQLLNELENLNKTITSLYAVYTAETDIAKKKEAIISLMSNMLDYEQKTTFAISLGFNKADIPESVIPETYESLFHYYRSLLADEESNISEKLKNSSNAISRASLEAQLKQNQLEQQQVEKQQELEIKNVQELALKQAEARVAQIVEANKVVSTAIEGYNCEAAQKTISAFKELENSLIEIISQCDALIKEESERLLSEYEIEKKAIQDRTYRIGELSGGAPSEVAIKHRQKELSDLRKRKDREYEQSVNAIHQGFFPTLKRTYDDLKEMEGNLGKIEYSASVTAGDIKILSTEYDGNSFRWQLTIEVVPFGWRIKVYLGYPEVTGKEVNTKTAADYEEYNTNVEFYDKKLREDFASYFDIALSFRIQYKDSSFALILTDSSLSSLGQPHTIPVEGETKRTITKGYSDKLFVPSWFTSELAKAKVTGFLSNFAVIAQVSASGGPGPKTKTGEEFGYDGFIASASAKTSLLIYRHALIGVGYTFRYYQFGTIRQLYGRIGVEAGVATSAGIFDLLAAGVHMDISKKLDFSLFAEGMIGLGSGNLTFGLEFDINKDMLLSPRVSLGYSKIFEFDKK